MASLLFGFLIGLSLCFVAVCLGWMQWRGIAKHPIARSLSRDYIILGPRDTALEGDEFHCESLGWVPVPPQVPGTRARDWGFQIRRRVKK